jgi:hypothetical protein
MQRRKRLVNRIDAAIENAPPHSRTQRLVRAAKARNVATAQHGAAIEAELDALARTPLSDDEWLAAIAHLESARPKSSRARKEKPGFQICGLLLMRNDSRPLVTAAVVDSHRVPRLGRTTTLHDVLGDTSRTDIL